MGLSFTAADLIEATQGVLVQGDPSAAAPEISTDTRELRPGEWFLALQGANHDGHDFLPRAVERGAAGVIVARDVDAPALGPAAILRVPDTLTAYGAIAQAWRRRLNPKVAVIAGSSGKTTTKEMAARALGGDPSVLVTPKNDNNLVGLPKVLLRLEETHRLVLAEIGMNVRGELDRLTRIAEPDLAALTNVGNAHVGQFGSLEGLLEAKAEMLIALRGGTRLLANADCPRSAQIIERFGHHLDVVRFAVACQAPYRAESIERLSPWGYAFALAHPNGRERIESHAFGRHNVYNALCAAALACELGCDPKAAAEGVSAFRPSAMRSEIARFGPYTIIEDCYNASPASTELVLESLGDVEAAGRRRLLMGDMLELGADEEMHHRQIGRAVGRVAGARLYAVGERA
ncbi:MAG: UDP-N-acetylmuramoyl-tripeptide--D-alanyl-D-alanine ligase, partial [Candidatus Sumerlaeota bacterium]|nr:UDP-N-acetylmuramoyl-tripeptide--D-alanyl-D-alanine ligase [Candidatus Sumerlaeota bacterium]